MEVARLMEQLCRHMVPSSSSSSSSSFARQDDPDAAATTTTRDAPKDEALLRSCLHKLGTCRRPPEAALDEFFTLQHAQRKVRRQNEGTGQEERGWALANRLDELYFILRKSIHDNQKKDLKKKRSTKVQVLSGGGLIAFLGAGQDQRI
jgi:hypothetical protein